MQVIPNVIAGAILFTAFVATAFGIVEGLAMRTMARWPFGVGPVILRLAFSGVEAVDVASFNEPRGIHRDLSYRRVGPDTWLFQRLLRAGNFRLRNNPFKTTLRVTGDQQVLEVRAPLGAPVFLGASLTACWWKAIQIAQAPHDEALLQGVAFGAFALAFVAGMMWIPCRVERERLLSALFG